jgi:hypothetical protein
VTLLKLETSQRCAELKGGVILLESRRIDDAVLQHKITCVMKPRKLTRNTVLSKFLSLTRSDLHLSSPSITRLKIQRLSPQTL